jgi:hypothetical protein
MSLTATGKIAVRTIVIYVLLGAFTYYFLWDKLSMEKKDLTIRFSDETVYKIYLK